MSAVASAIGIDIGTVNNAKEGMKMHENHPLALLLSDANLASRTPTELIYHIDQIFCDSLVPEEERFGSMIYQICSTAVKSHIILLKVSSSDDIEYQFELFAGLRGDANLRLLSLGTTVESPNVFGQSFNFANIFSVVQGMIAQNPELGPILNSMLSSLEGAISYRFMFSTTGRASQCNNGARSCLIFNIDETIKLKAMDGEIVLKHWDASPRNNPTVSFYNMNDEVLQIDLNNGAIDFAASIFDVKFGLGRLKAKATIYPEGKTEIIDNTTNKQPIAFSIENLSLESGLNWLERENQRFSINLNEGNPINTIKLGGDHSELLSMSPHVITLDGLTKAFSKAMSLYEKLFVNVNKSDDSDLITLCLPYGGTSLGDSNKDAWTRPRGDTTFQFLDFLQNMLVYEKLCDDMIGVVSGFARSTYDYGFQNDDEQTTLGEFSVNVHQGQSFGF